MLLPLILAVQVVQAEPTVSIEVASSRFASGAEITASVTNAMGESIFVPACETMQIESFDEEQGRWLPTSSGGCRETRAAVGLTEGTHSLSARFETDRFSIVRLVLVFGMRCREGFSLEMAGCEEFRAATSMNLTVAPAEE